MSASLARQPTKPHDIFDDLESLLWVLLFYAVRNFRFRGEFDMQLFKEGKQVPNEKLGMASVGGTWKFSWIQCPDIVFECQPLQDFFTSFRSFHNERYRKLAVATPGQESQNELDAFEAEVHNDVYSLLSHFDDILNDPNTDWTGQESRHVSQNCQQEPARHVPESAPAEEPQPIPHPEVQQSAHPREARKRKRGESEDDDEDPRKCIAIARDGDDAPSNIQPTHVRTRRRTPGIPVPTDRTLRPRTRR